MSFLYQEPGLTVGQILMAELGLKPGEVIFSNQKWPIPTLGLLVVVSYVGPAKILASMSDLIPDGAGGQLELQSVTMLHMLQIDMMAYNDAKSGNQARARFGEIPMALASIYSQQLQEQFSMNIARHPGPFVDTSYLDGTEMYTRYTTRLMTVSVNQKQKATANYYETFQTQINTDPKLAGQPIEADPAAAHP